MIQVRRTLIRLVLTIGLIFPLLHCASSNPFTVDYTFSSNDELFQALDAGTRKWKTFYDNANPSLEQLTDRLEKITQTNREKILSSVRSGPTDHRIVAAKTLQFLQTDQDVLEAINHALADSNQSVRKHALFALGYMRPDWSSYPDTLSSVKANVKKHARSHHASERTNAYYAIFGMVTSSNARGFREVLKQGLKDPELSVRNQAVRAFQVLKSPGAVPLLINVTLRDSSELVRFNTLRALRNQDDPRAIPELIGLLKNAKAENPFFVRRTTDLLQDLTGRRDLTTPEDWVQWYRLEQMLETPPSKEKVRGVLSRLLSFLENKERLDELEGYTTRIVRNELRSLFREVTGKGSSRSLGEWVQWYQKLDDRDKPLPVQRKGAVLARTLELLANVRNRYNELTDRLVSSLQFLSGITARSQMNTPDLWLKWYQKNRSEIRSVGETDDQSSKEG